MREDIDIVTGEVRHDAGITPSTSQSVADTPAADPVARTGAFSILGALATALSACGGGGGGGGSTSPPPPPPPPPALQYTLTEAARFLLQAQFTASDAEITAVRTQGYSAWLSSQYFSPRTQTGFAWLNTRGLSNPTAAGEYFDPTMGNFMAWKQLMAVPLFR